MYTYYKYYRKRITVINIQEITTLKQIKKFLDKGLDINTTDKYGSTLLHYACQNSNLKLIEYLLKNGAHIESKNRYFTHYPIFEAITSTNTSNPIEMIKLLISYNVTIDKTDAFGNTLLHYAVELKNIPLIKLLKKHGLSSHLTLREDQDSPLDYAKYQKNREIIDMLL